MAQKLPRAIKNRIRILVAYELRFRVALAEPDGETAEVLAAWHDYVREIANQISAE